MKRLSELEKWRIAELAAQGLPSRVIGKEIGRAHRTVWAYIRVLLAPHPFVRSLHRDVARPTQHPPLAAAINEEHHVRRAAIQWTYVEGVAYRQTFGVEPRAQSISINDVHGQASKPRIVPEGFENCAVPLPPVPPVGEVSEEPVDEGFELDELHATTPAPRRTTTVISLMRASTSSGSNIRNVRRSVKFVAFTPRLAL